MDLDKRKGFTCGGWEAELRPPQILDVMFDYARGRCEVIRPWPRVASW